jgi:Predicted membrane protein
MRKRILTFSKAQLSAFIGGITDYAIMVSVTEVFHVPYTISIVIGGIIGAVVNFNLNKMWTFNTKDIPYRNSINVQVLKFTLVALNSILLKTTGTYVLTRYMGIDYKISRLFIDLFVSLLFNYSLQKFWVFRKAY